MAKTQTCHFIKLLERLTLSCLLYRRHSSLRQQKCMLIEQTIEIRFYILMLNHEETI